MASALILGTLAAAVQVAELSLPAEIRPLLTTHCVDCHEGARAKGGLDLSRALEAGRIEESALRDIRRRLARRDMPPADEPVFSFGGGVATPRGASGKGRSSDDAEIELEIELLVE